MRLPSGRWYLLCSEPEVWGDMEFGHFFWYFETSVVLASAEHFLVFPLTQRPTRQPLVETEPGSMVIRQSMEALRSISSCLSCRVRTWKSYVSSYLAVFVLCLGVVEEYSIGLLGRFFSCAMLGSTVDTCSASVLGAFGRLYICSSGKWTRILKWFFSVLLQNGEVCSVEASVFSPVTHSSHLEPGQYFDELHVTKMRDHGEHFRRMLRHFSELTPNNTNQTNQTNQKNQKKKK